MTEITATHHRWTNWSGSVHSNPLVMVCPETEAEIAEVVRGAISKGRRVRPLGAGHSSSPLVPTDDVLLSLESFTGLLDHDAERSEATVRAGTTLSDAGDALHAVGLAFHNLGDIDKQTIAGAFSTGTHGSGYTLPNLASLLIGGRLVTSDGEIRAFSIEQDPDLTAALQVSLGTLGILTELRLRLLPSYQLHRQEWCAHIDDCLVHLPELVERNRTMDFYWYPRSDEAKIRLLNMPDEGTTNLPYARLVQDKTDWSHSVIAQQRELRFEEMEFALPAENGPPCFQEIRERVKTRHRHLVGWRTLYRTVAPDGAFLSPAHGRQTVTISLHQNATLPYQEYFADIEPIFKSYGGRPHWGKKHSMTADDLRPLYPKWDQFQRIRRELDPDGIFLSAPLRELLETTQ
jgi:FAD/FMN-containing dehydrogenase